MREALGGGAVEQGLAVVVEHVEERRRERQLGPQLDRGQPIRDEYVTLLRESETVTRPVASWHYISARKTDADGRLALQLMAGEYGLMRGTWEPGTQAQPSATLTWTSTGPLVERVQL